MTIEEWNTYFDPLTGQEHIFDKNELNLRLTLNSGQTFRWIETQPGEWTSIIGENYLVTLCHSEMTKKLLFKCHNTMYSSDTEQKTISEINSIISSYFRFDVGLAKLWQEWCAADKNFAIKSIGFEGVRVLNQNFQETLLSFICSSNNNIKRISAMIQNMCAKYGDLLGKVKDIPFYSFPSCQKLCEIDGNEGIVEKELKKMGFGYRAKYIIATAHLFTQQLKENPGFVQYLHSLSNVELCTALRLYTGVGRKVADCIALFSLSRLDVIPVDTHVWQIACRDYRIGNIKEKNLTDKVHDLIGEHFRALFGDMAGWAHSILFTADLQYSMLKS